jgi:uracil-DNA glycosylase
MARRKVRRFEKDEYWGRPVTGFGDPRARLLVVGLAPAVHGANRTGRLFTGDRSGDFLFAALHRAGFANQPISVSRADGLTLQDAYVSAIVRCAPPANKPLPLEVRRCRPFLARELACLTRLRVVLALGRIAMDGVLGLLREQGRIGAHPAYTFGHGVRHDLGQGLVLFASYHPSQQNTFTGKLTPAGMDRVLNRVRDELHSP